MAKKTTAKKNSKSFEETLWDSANKLRGSVEPAEYKHVVLSLIFLKFASDKFVERRQEIIDEGKGKFVDMVEFYTMKNVFYLLEESRWSYIQANAKQDDLALKIDTALHTIEKTNKSLAGALPDNFARAWHGSKREGAEMPRQPRLDAPGTLHHVIIRGIEKRPIVADAEDRQQFVSRLGQLALELHMPIYAWALLTNHAHLLVRSGPGGLPAIRPAQRPHPAFHCQHFLAAARRLQTLVSGRAFRIPINPQQRLQKLPIPGFRRIQQGGTGGRS